MKTRKRTLEPATESIPNLAPMVDVIMVLLVFFLLGATLNLSEEGTLQTELDPSSGPGEGVAFEVIPSVEIGLINVGDGDGVEIMLNNVTLPEADSFAALRDSMRARLLGGSDPTNPVTITAQTGVRWKYVIAAMDAALRAGFKNVQFGVSVAE